MPVQRIVFMQGDDADEPLAMLDTEGIESVLDYLAQWDMDDNGELTDEPSAGTSDDTYEVDGYILTWNNQLGYIGLERRV